MVGICQGNAYSMKSVKCIAYLNWPQELTVSVTMQLPACSHLCHQMLQCCPLNSVNYPDLFWWVPGSEKCSMVDGCQSLWEETFYSEDRCERFL